MRTTEEKRRLRMVQSLVTMAAADGRIGGRERKLIARFCASWGVEPAALDELVAAAKQGKRSLHLPKGGRERRTLLEALIAVAAVDGVIDDGERQCLGVIANRMGIPQHEQDRLLSKAARRSREATHTPPEAAVFEVAHDPLQALLSQPIPEPVLRAKPVQPAVQAIVRELAVPTAPAAPAPASRLPIVLGVGAAFFLCTLIAALSGYVSGQRWVEREATRCEARAVPTEAAVRQRQKQLVAQARTIRREAETARTQADHAHAERESYAAAKEKLAELNAARKGSF